MEDWKEELCNNVTTLKELGECITLTNQEKTRLQAVLDLHPMTVTRYYLSLMNPEDVNDPIRKMAIPSVDELDVAGFQDTSGEKSNTMLSGLQHKYKNTVLLLSSSVCSMYCRHCFRKRMVGLTKGEVMQRFNDAYEYICAHKEVNNVLISGGDSFILSTKIISKLLAKLDTVEHLDYIRFGTRMPVVYPDRVLKDPELVKVLYKYSRKGRRIHINTQFNHPREITFPATEAIGKLLSAGVIMNNQTVLLKGVNDTPEVLARLQRNLVRIGVNPYYVFQCRPVSRVKSHFQISLADGIKIVDGAKALLDGISKRFRYAMSHERGKIEIIGVEGDRMFFKHQQAKDLADNNKFFSMKYDEEAGWLDELED